MGAVGTYKLLCICRDTSLPKSFVIFQQRVPLLSIFNPLEMPLRKVSVDGVSSMKSVLSFEMQLEVPVSMQIGFPPGVKFIKEDDDACTELQAQRYDSLSEVDADLFI
jgi:hypothetical protein